MSDGYNGWANWKTWLLNLHYEELIRVFVSETWRCKASDIKDFIEELWEVPEGLDPCMKDILNGCLSDVNWVELLNHYLPDEEDEEEDEDGDSSDGSVQETITHWTCETCDTVISGRENDTRDSLARQIGGSVDEQAPFETSLVCSCGAHMKSETEEEETL